MAKAITKITTTFLISSLLAIGGLAQPNNFWPDLSRLDQKGKKKDPEKPVEKDKKKNDQGGGKKEGDKGKGKRP